MADKSMIMRNFQTTKPDVIAFTQSMDIIALAHPDIEEFADQSCLGDDEILGARDFHIPALSFKDMHRVAGPFGNRGVIGEFGLARGGGLAMRGENQVEAKGLRGLYGP